MPQYKDFNIKLTPYTKRINGNDKLDVRFSAITNDNRLGTITSYGDISLYQGLLQEDGVTFVVINFEISGYEFSNKPFKVADTDIESPQDLSHADADFSNLQTYRNAVIVNWNVNSDSDYRPYFMYFSPPGDDPVVLEIDPKIINN